MFSSLARLRRSARRARGAAVVLLYHRIASPDHDHWGNCVDPKRFAEHLESIATRFHPISLRDLGETITRGAIPPQSVCVTFDDGYRDNLDVAKPLLERYEVPATVFVVSGYVDSGREFWWDELERLCLYGDLPRTLRLELPGEVFVWEASNTGAGPNPSWRAWHRPQTERQELYVLLYERLIALDDRERRAELGRVASLVGTDRRDVLTSTTREITCLGDGDLVEIGAHTVTHPRLSDLPASLQYEEIAGAKTELEELLGRPVESFAYPHSSYDDVTITAVREAGYALACGGPGRGIAAHTSVFDIPRIPAENWSGDELVRRVSSLIGQG